MTQNTNFDDLLAKLILAIPKGELLGLPHDITMERLIQSFPEEWDAIYREHLAQQATAATCDDAIQTPTFGVKRR